MTARAQFTPTQKRIAVALLAELRGMYVARLDHMQSVIGVFLTADLYLLPLPASLDSVEAFESIDALSAGMDEFAGLIERAEIVAPTNAPPRAEAGPVPAHANDGTSPGHHLDDKRARGDVRAAA